MNVGDLKAQQITAILLREGPFKRRDPDDTGGITNWGITVPWLSALVGKQVTSEYVMSLTQHQAGGFYAMWLDQTGLTDLAALSFELFDTVVDYGVHSGHVQAIKDLQRAVGVTDDGVLGPKTLDALKWANTDRVIRAVVAARLLVMATSIKRSPPKQKYAEGWMRRVAAVLTPKK